ncbi:MAG: hypothetical protein MUE68_12990 [Bacteroidetes bacterium]|jgi:predicted GH43/DUF377 family glycosyl hydrolase|nr:hypothetical protein [Bacteroidota bacterium]
MNRHQVVATASFVALILALFSCETPVQQQVAADQTTGLFSVSMAKSSIPSEVARITALLTRPSSAPIRDSLSLPSIAPDTVVWTLRQIPVGTWEVLLQAFDSSGLLRYSGSAIVGIMQDRTTQATIIMQPVGSGVGSLQLFVVWGQGRKQWHLPTTNPVVQQTLGTYDADHYWLQKCWVLKDGATYKMYYHTGVGSNQEIALATSTDGSAWTKQGVVIPKNASIAWMSMGSSCPSVLKVDGLYKMWFNGKGIRMDGGIPVETPHNGIGFAQSADGVSWSINGSQLIPLDSTLVAVFAPSVFHDAGQYHMWYTIGRRIPATLFAPERTGFAVIYARSSDGLTWHSQQEISLSNSSSPWQSDGIVTPYVYRNESGWVMYFTGASNGHLRIGRAQSSDGAYWVQSSADPEFSLVHAAPWQITQVAYPSVIEENGVVRMWFSGLNAFPERWQIGYAEKQ